MKDKLIEIFNLPPTATEDQIVAAAASAAKVSGEAKTHHAREKAIRDKIQQSAGAMSREVAIQALQAQKHPLFRN